MAAMEPGVTPGVTSRWVVRSARQRPSWAGYSSFLLRAVKPRVDGERVLSTQSESNLCEDCDGPEVDAH